LGFRFNPPPGWPPVPEGFAPQPGWLPDPDWPPAPQGWPLWVDDDTVPGAAAAGVPPGQFPRGFPASGYQVQPAGKGTSGFAIASFVLGLVGGVLLSVIFGIVALVKIRRRPQRGKGLAVAGLVLSGVWIVAVAAGIAINVANTAHRSSTTGQVTGKGHVSVFSLRAGDCLQNPPASQAGLRVTQVTAVPCATAHDAQVYAQFHATGNSHPGQAGLARESSHGCAARAAASLDKSKITSTMQLQFIYPDAQAWANGRRTISCLIVDSTPDLTSSLLRANPAGG